jgi:membrane fusion protein, heavy metal efflux system
MKVLRGDVFRFCFITVLVVITIFCRQGFSEEGHEGQGHEESHGHGEYKIYQLKDKEVKVEITSRFGGPRFVVSQVGKDLTEHYSLHASVSRLANISFPLSFSLQNGQFVSDESLPEPHSFSVDFTLSRGVDEEKFMYSQIEQRLTIPQAMQSKLGIESKEAIQATIAETLHANGRVIAPHNRIAHVFPRFPGVVKAGYKHTGDRVKKGDTLAEIESNLNFTKFSLTSPIDGQIIEGHLVAGEFVPQNREVFTIVNLEKVWIDFLLPPGQVAKVTKDASIEVSLPEDNRKITTTIDLLFPVADPSSQLLTARAVVDNSKAHLHPGHIVQGIITVSTTEVPVAVETSAVQRMFGGQVVFVTDGVNFEPTVIKTGSRSGELFEVTEGLPSGTRYATGNTFLLKAEIQKELAHHAH